MLDSTNKYQHSEELHNLKDPKIIVPEIIKLIQPNSVVDFGCGLGTFLYVFKSLGIQDVLGIDGAWVNKSLVSKYLQSDEFLEQDLEKEITLDKTFDLVISLEVAEHLSADSADSFVKNLVNAGNVILFSAAIPNQGGQNHINEQWLDYWEVKFEKHGYKIHDVVKPIFWDNPDVFWWYKQNMVFITPENFEFTNPLKEVPMKNVIHYDLFTNRMNKFHKLLHAKESPKFYLKLFLRSLFRSK